MDFYRKAYYNDGESSPSRVVSPFFKLSIYGQKKEFTMSR